MSRFAAPDKPPEEDFAALLERLTGSLGVETAGRDSGAYYIPGDRSRTTSGGSSASPADGRVKPRSLPPAKELKAGRGGHALDGAELSYEKALRLHARRRVDPDADLPQSDAIKHGYRADLSRDSTKVESTGIAPPGRTASSSLKPGKAAPNAKGAAPSDGKADGVADRFARPQRKAKAGAPPQSKTKSNKLPASRKTRTKKEETAKFQLQLQRDELHISQRRSPVSVRLTEAEFAQLRDRAGESGISVSAYMRSCVLDAEILRTQVKQALAEMRAFSPKPEPMHLPAIVLTRKTNAADGYTWLQVLHRSVTSLLGPLFQFGRSA